MKGLKQRVNNKGLSIIELLLVMVISIMILSFLLISYNVVNNANVNKSAKRMESILKATKVAAMSRGQAAGVVNFTVVDGRLFAVTAPGTADEKRELICNANVVVSVGTDGVAPAIGTQSVGSTVAFNPNGRIRDSITTGDFFVLSKGTRMFKVVVHRQTGAIECSLYSPAPESGEGGEGGEGGGT